MASFFVSRVDTAIDPLLDKIGSPEAAALRGQAAIANARLAYGLFQEVLADDRWTALAAAGAHPQRPLWASTGVKDKAYPDTLYVDDLVVAGVVNTMPEATLKAVADHGGDGHDTVTGTGAQAESVIAGLRDLGIDIDDVTEQLEIEGVDKFTASWGELLGTVSDGLQRRGPAERVGSRQVSPSKVSAEHNPLRDPRDRRLPRIAGPCGLVIFGVTGDLARKKLMPAVYDLTNRGLLPPGFALTGFARRDWATQDFAEIVHDSVREHARTPFREATWRQLSEGIRFVQGTFDDDDAFDRLRDTVEELDVNRGTGGNHAFYLSVPPSSFPVVCKQLARSGLSHPTDNTWRRVVIEKPFGHDLASARELNEIVSEVFHPGRHLPDRPLPGQGDGAEPAGAALRQPAVRAHLERQLRRPHPDHDGRGHRDRGRARPTTTASAPRAT